MDRKRHEPTYNPEQDLKQLEFQRRYGKQARESQGISPWIYIAVSAALLVAIAMGLIEWNARRQAAAMTRELTRPMTAQEQADFNAEMDRQARQLQAETAAEVAAVQQTIQLDRLLPMQERRPLEAGERCIEGRRFQKIQGGWRDLPNDPC